MGGLSGNDHRFDSNCSGVDSSKVAAIIDRLAAGGNFLCRVL
jgi:hypothetical protein